MKIVMKDSIDYFKQQSAKAYDVKVEDLSKRTRRRTVVEARHTAMYLLCQFSDYSLKEIGKAFGKRDHSTVIHARRNIRNLVTSQDHIRYNVNSIIENYYS